MKNILRIVLYVLQWTVVIAVVIPLIPLSMSLCAGIYLVVAAADKGQRRENLSLIGGTISIVISAIGIFITYELVRLIFY
jgi:hypothetical protein